MCAPYWAWRSSLMMHSCRFSTESFNSSSIRLARSKLCRPKSTVVLSKLTSMLIQLRLTILVFIFIICAPYWAIGARCGSTMHSIKNAIAKIGSKNTNEKASNAAITPIGSFILISSNLFFHPLVQCHLFQAIV